MRLLVPLIRHRGVPGFDNRARPRAQTRLHAPSLVLRPAVVPDFHRPVQFYEGQVDAKNTTQLPRHGLKQQEPSTISHTLF